MNLHHGEMCRVVFLSAYNASIITETSANNTSVYKCDFARSGSTIMLTLSLLTSDVDQRKEWGFFVDPRFTL